MSLPTSEWKRSRNFFPSRDGDAMVGDALGIESGMHQRHSVAAVFRGALARHARVIPERVTCWRRLRHWQEQESEKAWRQLLASWTNAADRLERGLVDATFLQAKKGARRLAKPCGAREGAGLAVERHGTPLGVYVCPRSLPSIMWRSRCWPPFECDVPAVRPRSKPRR